MKADREAMQLLAELAKAINEKHSGLLLFRSGQERAQNETAVKSKCNKNLI